MKRPKTWGRPWGALALCLCTTLAGFRVPAESPIAAEGLLEPDMIPFHRVARYGITVTAPKDAELSVAPWAETPPGLRVEAAPPESRALDGERQQWTQVWTLSPAAAGEYALPEVVVLTGDTPVATLAPATLRVRALTPEEQAAAEAPIDWIGLDDLSESGARPVRGLTGWLIAVGALLLVALGLYQWRRRRRFAPSPHEVALSALRDLDLALGAETVDSVEFHVRLAAILRVYLAARFFPEASAMSTPEFARELLPHLPLDTAAAHTLQDVLTACDRVKFARKQPTHERCGRHLLQVRTVITLLETPAGESPDTRRGAA